LKMAGGGPLATRGRTDRRFDRNDPSLSDNLCRSCAQRSGHLVLDLGSQPACDTFPDSQNTGPDPAYPLQMWLCSACGLAQLLGKPTTADEPRGVEPEALVAQAFDAVERLATAGWLSDRNGVVEFASPHGGSWLSLLTERGLAPVADEGPADVVIDSFGMMHDPDQRMALATRTARVAHGGVLLLQYHSLETIVRRGQWNALRHGHFAYYSTSTLVVMLEAVGFQPSFAWRFDLYGGTVLLAATRGPASRGAPDDSIDELLAEDAATGVRDPEVVSSLQDHAEAHARGLREWLVEQQTAGRTVLGYGAASRAVALLCRSGVDRGLLPAVIDTSPSKHGLRMPGTDIPIIDAARLATSPPQSVLLFVPDLLTEVRREFPAVEQSGGEWVDAEALHV
jgi:hypothetical protein